ncbi:phage terminase large subunit family protein, partial [Escherichia coli]|uniref:phage tail fiber protein n=1 Tax=Escherichia coli TaxID=562 RepID=UPI0020186104
MLNQETAKAARTDSGYILRAPRRMQVADAVAQYMRVPMGAGNSVPWDPLVAPYVIEPMNCLASREYDAVIFVGPARTGKTIGLIDGWVIYNVICDPADMLIIQMTEEKAREHSKKRLARTFRVSPEVVSRLSPNKNDNNVYDRTFLAGKGDDLRSVFYVDGAAFPVFAFIEDGLSISAPGADLVVNDTTYKFGVTNPATECIAADVILDFKSGRGFYESHSLIVNDNLSCKKLFATDEIVARGGNQIRMIGGEYGALWRNDGAKTYLLLTNQGDVYGGWNTLRPFAIDNATGELVIGTKLSASLNGNALTATKLQTPRLVSGVEFDGSRDITLTAAHVAAFARRATDTYADADGGVP